jgi:arginyl-tRNA synthetase
MKKIARQKQEIAEQIAAQIQVDRHIQSVEIAGPGFINLELTATALHDQIRQAYQEGDDFARASHVVVPDGSDCVIKPGGRVNLEFISANPTGPMHVGHGRWAALGNALGNLLEHAGWQVTREFYINDAGRQMDVFGKSLVIRYLELLGETIEHPEDFYAGAYVIDIAKQLLAEEGERWAKVDPAVDLAAGSAAKPVVGSRDPATDPATDSTTDFAATIQSPTSLAIPTTQERLVYFREYAYRQMLRQMQELCARIDVPFDVWYSERSLYQADQTGSSPIDRCLQILDQAGYLYQKEGATWFRSTDFGDDKDRVLIKADGSYTYFCPDIAYHASKFDRGSDFLIDIWGADHHGYVQRMQAAIAAIGHTGGLSVLLGQLVNLFRDGEVVRMSKRTGEMISFEELIDEVGADATKYLMLARSSEQAIDFDIEAAKRADNSNPVYYVQYAHARICSLLSKAREAGVQPADIHLELLTDPSELDLARNFSRLPDLIEIAARDMAPYRLTHYAEELASDFHSFYTRCQVISDDQVLSEARLYLAAATKSVLALVLRICGVSAPEKM